MNSDVLVCSHVLLLGSIKAELPQEIGHRGFVTDIQVHHIPKQIFHQIGSLLKNESSITTELLKRLFVFSKTFLNFCLFWPYMGCSDNS